MTDPRIEPAARALNTEGWTCQEGSDEPGNYGECEDCKRYCDELATAALAAADKTATITTVGGLDALPVGSVILDRYGDVSQKRGTVNSNLWYSSETAPLSTWHVRKFLPATIIHWGTE